MQVVGVDGCRAGWVAVATLGGGFQSARLFERFAALLAAFPEACVIGTDIPIGLVERGHRAADLAARCFLGAAARSVFLTPPRRVLEARSYARAREVARALGGPGVSAQAYALRGRILEVDPLAVRDKRIVEVHPEVSFRALAGRALDAGKKTPAGQRQRRRLLAQAEIRLPRVRSRELRGVAEHDLLDAAAAAWSARRVARGQARSLPESPEPGEREIRILY